MDAYRFLFWEDEAERLEDELRAQDTDFMVELHGYVDKTVQHGWSRSECLELLDGRYETYAVRIPGYRRSMMLVREAGSNCYLYLGLTGDRNAREAVYRLACRAFGLRNPPRRRYDEED